MSSIRLHLGGVFVKSIITLRLTSAIILSISTIDYFPWESPWPTSSIEFPKLGVNFSDLTEVYSQRLKEEI